MMMLLIREKASTYSVIDQTQSVLALQMTEVCNFILLQFLRELTDNGKRVALWTFIKFDSKFYRK